MSHTIGGEAPGWLHSGDHLRLGWEVGGCPPAPRPDPLLPERLRHVTLVSSSSSSSTSSSTHICKKHRIYPLHGSHGPGTLKALLAPYLFQTHNSPSQILLLLWRKEQALWDWASRRGSQGGPGRASFTPRSPNSAPPVCSPHTLACKRQTGRFLK